MQVQVYNLNGEVSRTLELNDYIFGIEPNLAVVHQAVVRQQANARQGTHSTKDRTAVRGGGRKPYRQKGTGRARQGSNRSPQWRGGAVVFGPHPRSYEKDLPRKMRRLAARSVLSIKAADGQIILIEGLHNIEPRTKTMITLLAKLNLTQGKGRALIMLASREENVYRAAHNIEQCELAFAQYLSLVDMLKYEYLLLTPESLELIGSILGDGMDAFADDAAKGELKVRTPSSDLPTTTVDLPLTDHSLGLAEAVSTSTAEMLDPLTPRGVAEAVSTSTAEMLDPLTPRGVAEAVSESSRQMIDEDDADATQKGA